MTRPRQKILVSQRLVPSAHGEIRQCLDIQWSAVFAALQLLPVPVSYGVPLAWYAEDTSIAGALLTGGNDLASCADDPVSRQRDALERELVDLMLTRGRPVMGVCRGCQFLAEHLGGRVGSVDGHAGTRHGIRATDGGTAVAGRIDVNSFHNFGVLELGPGSESLALSADGSIEAFRQPANRVLGIMWHPEREAALHRDDLALMSDHFALEAENS